MTERRGRPTLRCLTDDLDLDVPPLDVDLGDVDHPFLTELRRVTPTSPQGQKRVLSIDHPLVYRVRVSRDRGVTWVDDERSVVWLCAARRREQDSDSDAYAYFAELHSASSLLPDDDDRLRDRAEAVIRLQRDLTAGLLDIVDRALVQANVEQRVDLGGWLPCRVLVVDGAGLEEIWCALSVRAVDDAHVSAALRDVLFAGLDVHVAAVASEPRVDWPSGEVEWFEVVRLSLR
jgi:hypothetical protein